MPYSDNLYSALDDEFDDEPIGEPSSQRGEHGPGLTAARHAGLDTLHAFADTYADPGELVDTEDPHALSPTDGYFGSAPDTPSGTGVPASAQVPHVPNVLVEDPSLQRNTAESKAREAEQERLRSERGSSDSVDGGASAHPSHTTTSASRNGAAATRGLTPTPSVASDSQSAGATYYSPSSASYTGRHDPAANRPQRPHPGEPNMSYPDIDDGFRWNPEFYCKDVQIPRHIQTYDVTFGTDKQLVLLERVVDDDGRRTWDEVHVQGAVILRRSGPETPNSAVTVEVTVTDERLIVSSTWDADSGTLKVSVPHRVEWSHGRPRACVNVKVTVWVPEGSKLKSLEANVVHLDIKLLDNLSLSVADGTKLTSVVGAISAAASTGAAAGTDELIDTGAPESFYFNSRIIDVKTMAAPITGSWPLYDYLGLQSTSGNIKVTLDPKEDDPDLPKPAILYIKTLSGNVDFRAPILAAERTFRIGQVLPAPADRLRAARQAAALLPPRDYRVDVYTTSGDVTGAAAFSADSTFVSTSGTLSLDLLPVLRAEQAEPGGRSVELKTSSTSAEAGAPPPPPPAPYLQGGGGGGKRKFRGKPSYALLKTVQPQEGAAVTTTAGAAGDDDGNGKANGNDSPPPPLRCLSGSHSTASADIRLRYPVSWEGDLSLASLSGSLQVGGDGVRIVKSRIDWPGVNKQILARKGEKGAGETVTVKSTAGNVLVWVGQD
ncbi:75e0e052-2973-41ec-983c-35fac2ee2d5d [Thermothielavioides terrestris]|uniref:75e0e052-2973-41ec-983c-35fac2ee2d5d n=1 Tax=Thermothielavioides terrestris TaxID=2587410 RepID=A0A446BCV4_9PEZI|nr:75e0e052-2973-41ec-983c-35fac2ee2d5d [Thermothielavioides terrestris]